MTDRIRSLTVILENDTRTDDVESVTDAIRMVRGVHSVTLGKPVNLTDLTARIQARSELRKKIGDLLWADD